MSPPGDSRPPLASDRRLKGTQVPLMSVNPIRDRIMKNSEGISNPGKITASPQKSCSLPLATPSRKSTLGCCDLNGPLGRFGIGAGVGAIIGLLGWLLAGRTIMPGVFNPFHAAVF